MHKILLTLTLALLGAAPTLAEAQAPPAAGVSVPSAKTLYQDGHAKRYLMDGTWLYRADPSDQGLGQRFERQTGTAGWNPISVPYAWNATDTSDGSQRGSVGWYRKDFKLPAHRRGTDWNFRFESVNYRATVFLNGKELGEHRAAYIPFEIFGGRLKGGVNHLVVRVDNRRSNTDIPPLQDQTNTRPGGGWWNYGGLLREVYLRPIDKVDMTDFSALPILPCRNCPATVRAKATLHNIGGGARKVKVTARVGSSTVRFPVVKVPSGGTKVVQGKVKIRDPRLWSTSDPQLYNVTAAAAIRGKRVSGWRTHIGIRSFRVSRDGRLLLNGRPIKLRGASFHEDSPDNGAALNPVQRNTIVQQYKDLGATVARVHYPPHPAFLEAFDRAGILYYDEIPFYQFKADTLRLKSVREQGLAYLQQTISRDENHASVFDWAVGNELPSRVDKAQEAYINGARRLVDKLDPTRLISIDYAGYPSVPPIRAYRAFDAIGINSYFGWYIGPNGQIVDRDLLGPYLDQLHAYYPRQALMVTEFGAEANRNGPVDEKGTFQFQADLLDYHISTYESKPWINAEFVWILKDFKVRPDWDGGNPKPSPPYLKKGLIDEANTKKPSFFEAQRLFRNGQAASASSAGR